MLALVRFEAALPQLLCHPRLGDLVAWSPHPAAIRECEATHELFELGRKAGRFCVSDGGGGGVHRAGVQRFAKPGATIIWRDDQFELPYRHDYGRFIFSPRHPPISSAAELSLSIGCEWIKETVSAAYAQTEARYQGRGILSRIDNVDRPELSEPSPAQLHAPPLRPEHDIPRFVLLTAPASLLLTEVLRLSLPRPPRDLSLARPISPPPCLLPCALFP